MALSRMLRKILTRSQRANRIEREWLDEPLVGMFVVRDDEQAERNLERGSFELVGDVDHVHDSEARLN